MDHYRQLEAFIESHREEMLSMWADFVNTPSQARNRDAAWKTYLKYTELGGSMVFTDLLAEAGLRSPFDPESLCSIAKSVKAYLDTFDMTEIDG